ncbi:MAG TPA: hypothetical protein VI670_17455 [Thermoanaerobaculia bacterium]|jgi:hypothetical protein
MRQTLLLLAILVAGAAHAQIELGPEQPAVPFEPVTPSAVTAAMATSADGSLIAFQRTTTIHAQLLDRDGRPLTRSGFTIGASANATLGGAASNGSNYVVVTVTETQTGTGNVVETISLSLAGTPAPPRKIAGGTLRQPRIASNGRDYLVTWIEVLDNGNRQVRGRELDANGNPAGNVFAISDERQPCALCYGHVAIADDAVASDGRDYLVGFVDRVPLGEPEPNEVVFVPVANGAAGKPKSSRHQLKKISSVFSGPHYTIAFKELPDNFVYAASVDATGTIGPSHVIGEGSILSAASGPLVVLINYDGVQAVHLAGTLPIDTRPLDVFDVDFLLGVTAAGEPVAVRLGQSAPLEIAAVPPGQVFPARPLVWTPVVQFAKSQSWPLLVNAGDVDVLAWSDVSGLRATRVRNGAPLDVPALNIAPGGSSAVMAGGGGRALVAWQEYRRNDDDAIAGRIVAADGTVSPPFDIHAEKVGFDVPPQLEAAVWNGAGFTVVWSKNGRLWRACIDASGKITTPAAAFDLAVTFLARQSRPFLVPTSYGFLLLYAEEIDSRPDVFAAAFRADGSPLGTRVRVRATFDNETPVGVGSDGEGHLLAAISFVKIGGFVNDTLLVPLDERGNAGTLTELPQMNGSLLWTGTAYLLISGEWVAAADRDGRLLAPPARALSMPSLFTRDTAAYTRPDPDAGGAERLYVRRVILQPPRRRAARP